MVQVNLFFVNIVVCIELFVLGGGKIIEFHFGIQIDIEISLEIEVQIWTLISRDNGDRYRSFH